MPTLLPRCLPQQLSQMRGKEESNPKGPASGWAAGTTV